LFPVCSQSKFAKQRPFPVFRDFTALGQPGKRLDQSAESLKGTGNTENKKNEFDG